MRTQRNALLALGAAIMAFGAVGAAIAEPFRDDATGLAIEPPAGYKLEQLPAQGSNIVRVSLKRAEDRDTGCQVGYGDAPPNNRYSQADINAQMKTKEHQELARASIGVIYHARSVEPFEHGDVTGLAIVADIKPRQGVPARAQEIQNLMILMETPKGRTSVVCVSEKADFPKRRPEFEALARSVGLPA